MLLLIMLRGLLNKALWNMNRAALDKDVLTNSNIRTLVSYIGELHEEREGDLSLQDLALAVEARYRRPDGRRAELLELVEQLANIDMPDPEDIQPRIAEFLMRELGMQAALDIARQEDSDVFSLERARTLLERAREISTGVDMDVEDLAAAPPPEAAQERQGVITVGLGKTMDQHLAGGLGAGEMLIWFAPPGIGKTSLMINQGIAAARAGESVLHVSLEISRSKCRQRADQALTGMSRTERLANPQAVMAARRALPGKFLIKDWSARNVTVDDLRTLVLRLRANGTAVSVLSVDYLGLMEAVQANRHGPRFDYSGIAIQLRRLANELGVKLISAWQVNRAGADKHVLSGTDVAECWDIVMHADIILGLNQNSVELQGQVLRVNIIKQRESTARPIEYYFVNLDRMLIRSKQDEGDSDLEPDDEMDNRN